MNQSPFGHSSSSSHPPDLSVLVHGVVAGVPEHEETLFDHLREHLRVSVASFFPDGGLEADEVVVESITAVFQYLRREAGFDGDLVRFAITIARNRCRNIMNQRKRRPQTAIEPLSEWIANEDRSPLDNLLESEARAHLDQTIEKLGNVCRTLLRAFYFEEIPIEKIRQSIGLDTVQGVYYRRTVCLRELGTLLLAEVPG